MSRVLQIQEPPPRHGGAAPRGIALWQLGFRPFYLLASGFAALSVPLWALQVAGLLSHPYLDGPMWHAHEMLFGFVLAVIVGFLFTAGRNWSGRPTPSGPALAALAALWIAAAAGLGHALIGAGNRRNYFFVGLLVLLAVASLWVHLALLGVAALPAAAGIQLGLDVVLFIMVVMAGRVLPMFTQNGVPGARPRRNALLERLSLGAVLLLAAADLGPLPSAALALLAAVAAVLHLARWCLWQPWTTLRTPLVWVLHAAYLWIPLHLLLRAGAALGWNSASLATHALMVGAAGGLIIGMMTRTARGHTARPLRADHADIACYALVLCAAVVRVGLPLLWPAATRGAVLASAGLWSAGFGLYAVRYAPRLIRPRLDGRPG